MPKLPILEAREILKALKKEGFFEHHQVGSHIQLKHKDGRRVTVPMHKGKDIGRGMLSSILKQAKIEPEKFRKLL
jgi:predicted RNA binding protein YcfA (HicA-like mRNA interferase family)